MTAVEEQLAVHLDRVPKALEALRAGRPVIVVDDADRENEGDVVLAAATADERWVGWLVRHTSGYLCAPMPAARARALQLPPMVEHSQDPRGTAYTVSVDAAHGIGTGISAADRARTLRTLADPGAGPEDLIRPGHVLPLRAVPGGVLERAGHTEAAVDLCRLAGLVPVAAIGEVVQDDGPVMLLTGLRALADAHGLALISIADLAAHRLAIGDLPEDLGHGPGPAPTSARVQRVARAALPTRYGTFTAYGYLDLQTGHEHLALLSGRPAASGALVRVHSECLTGDALGSARCDCGEQLDAALAAITEHGGALLYLRGHEGRGIGLAAKLSAYALQDQGLDTVEANTHQGLPVDAREYGAAAAMLTDLGLSEVALMTNNPAKVEGLRRHGASVARRVAHEVPAGEFNRQYLATKRERMGHLLGDAGPSPAPSGSSGSPGQEQR